MKKTIEQLKKDMMNLANMLDLNGLENLWKKTAKMNGAESGLLRDAVMDVLESRYGVEKFDEWLDSPTEDFKIFA